MHRVIVVLIALLALNGPIPALAAGYLQSGSIGVAEPAEADCPEGELDYLPVRCWRAESVIFLPAMRGLQEYGYMDFSEAPGRIGHLSYDDAAGQIGIVESADREDGRWLIRVRMEDGRLFVGETLPVSLNSEDYGFHGIALLRELDFARRQYLGEVIWSNEKYLGVYDAGSDEVASVATKRFGPLEVVNVVAGWYDNSPVRFVVRDQAGVEGFIDVTMTGTNVSPRLRELYRFERSFFVEDPRVMYPWPDNVWEAVEAEQVFLGMTEEQARLSWGAPSSINKTVSGGQIDEQWVYDSGSYLYFEDGILISIQN